MYLSVTEVKALDGYMLLLRFENAEERVLDLKPYLDVGKFSELRDLSLFRSVKVSFDTIAWSNQLDLDPEFLYRESVPKV